MGRYELRVMITVPDDDHAPARLRVVTASPHLD